MSKSIFGESGICAICGGECGPDHELCAECLAAAMKKPATKIEFTTEVEVEDDKGNVEVVEVSTEMSSLEALQAAEAAYRAHNISHAKAVLAGEKSVKYAVYAMQHNQLVLAETGFQSLLEAQQFSVNGEHGLSPNGDWRFYEYPEGVTPRMVAPSDVPNVFGVEHMIWI